jgi:fructose-bisphosphate aldolase class I
MDKKTLSEIAEKLVAPGKGILAADESMGTMEKRLSAIGLPSTEENRKNYRWLLFSTPEVEEYISGVIMFDETLKQKGDNDKFLAQILSNKGIIPGIKVDLGTKDLEGFPGEKVTEGLDGLKERLVEYKNLGAQFTKWRAVITIGENIPSDECINQNSERLSQFAILSQEANLVPIVEPEVLMDGGHDINKCAQVTYKTLKVVFNYLNDAGVFLNGMLLKPNMMLPGKDNPNKATSDEIAKATLDCFKEVIPEEVPGIVFLSGGQSPEEATANLNAINILDNVSWQLSFSFGRALQEPVLKAWLGKEENVKLAQDAFYKRARLNSLARQGKYSPDKENI